MVVATIMVASSLGVLGALAVAAPSTLGFTSGGSAATNPGNGPPLTLLAGASETLTPSSGPPGTVVTISGSGLNDSQIYYYCTETTNTHIGCPSTYSFMSNATGGIPSGVTITLSVAVYVVIAGSTYTSSYVTDAHFTLQSMAVLAGNVPYVFAVPQFNFLWTNEGPTSGSQVLNISLYLAETNLSYLEVLVNELNTPGNPLYHHYLSPTAFQAEFYQSNKTVSAIETYYRQHGFVVWSYSYAPMVIVLQANVSTIDAQFEVTLDNINVNSAYAELENSYNYATISNPLISNLANPYVPSTYSSDIVSIYGMSYASDLDLEKSAITECVYLGLGCSQSGTPNGTMPGQGGVLLANNVADAGALSPAGSSSLLTPPNIENYYQLTPLTSAGYNGTGQKVGVIGVGQNFVYANEVAFWNTYGIYPHNVHLVNLTSNGLNPYPTGSEQELDLEMVGAMAPGAGIYDVQAAFNISSIPSQHGSLGDDSIILEIYYLLNVVDPNTITSSWGALQFQHGAAYETTYYQIGLQEAAEGITYFEGSSDSHSIYYLIAEEPPFSMSVGGVDNVLNATGVVQGQYAWYEPSGSFYGLQVGSGGGQSFFYPKPGYQVNEAISVPASYVNRSMPDLAFPANDVAYYGGGSRISAAGGTSFAAPLMAGAFADMESMMAARYGVTQYQLGWLQPVLYNLGYGTTYGYTAFSPVEYLQPSGTIQDGSYLGNSWNEWAGIGTPYMLNLTYDFMNYIAPEHVNLALTNNVLLTGANTSATLAVSNFGAPVSGTVSVSLNGFALESWNVVLTGPSQTIPLATNTLLPGLYTVSLAYLGGTASAELEIYNFVYPVTFTESGLPSGTAWYVNGTTSNEFSPGANGHASSTTSTLTSYFTNGTIPFSVATANKTWMVAQAENSIAITGSPASGGSFTFTLYAKSSLTVTESGLPGGTLWAFTLNGRLATSTGSTITFSNLVNGTYPIIASHPNGYTTSGLGHSATVAGASTYSVTYVPLSVTDTVYFTASGIYPGTSWSVTIGGTTLSSTTSTIVFSLSPGGYTYSVTAPAGYSTGTPSGSVTASSIPASVGITFFPVTYTVSFSESGLPGGTMWGLSFGGVFEWSHASTITFQVTPNTYPWLIGYISDYVPSQASGSTIISNSGASIDIVFTFV